MLILGPMRLEMVSQGELLPTEATFERLKIVVDLHVRVQMTPLLEAVPAHLAHVFLPLAVRLHVRFEVVLAVKFFMANVAGEFGAAVLLLVAIHVALALEALSASVAEEGEHFPVRLFHVKQKIGDAAGALQTDGTEF